MKAMAKLRQLLREPEIIVAPGADDCLTAKLIERAGFLDGHGAGSAAAPSVTDARS
jgi:2-methylisocitrate lyase-like PEP mutase family enzyme